jgi:hypothetical protein
MCQKGGHNCTMEDILKSSGFFVGNQTENLAVILVGQTEIFEFKNLYPSENFEVPQYLSISAKFGSFACFFKASFNSKKYFKLF